MNKRTLIALAAVWTAALALPAFAQNKEPIRIGAVLSTTGPAGYLGDPQLKTLQTYIAQINQEGGVLGRKLEMVHYDDASEAGKANGFAKRLIDDDKVDFLIAGTTTGATMAMAPLVEKAGIPLISLSGAVVVVEPVKKWIFKTPHTDRMAAEKVFEDMKKRGFAKVGLLSETSGFGQSGAKETKLVAQKYGITLVADETYGPKDTDTTAQLTKIRGVPGIQALLVFGLGQGPAVVTKNAAQLGMKLPLYQSHGVASNEFLKLAGPAAEGVRMPSPALLVANSLAANDPQRPLVTSYAATYWKQYKDEPSTFGGYALDALMLGLHAVKTTGGTNKEALRNAIEKTRGFMGTTGQFNMSATDHMGLDLSAFRMVEVKNGGWSLLK
ncbi:amino acid/amide ABC transporter substrate-binding protein, HAAT family (TC 3.A.1.4.-) [Polaromonas sp. YR568]|uniref:ABC transporter substrate-binding protein n=1 Tax=Polaromonas sp. YR568 TaxID=1855301 RepID=UPI0008EF89A3|nr:ABC transporter substrate-binding protein [Polaromonas sp. YR568]SFU66261.1 amino acid/amide ABC transporter substrate-binding protein, HAAT family (TC 3.A.1.4.-) [Polaromonas sp. YR568]